MASDSADDAPRAGPAATPPGPPETPKSANGTGTGPSEAPGSAGRRRRLSWRAEAAQRFADAAAAEEDERQPARGPATVWQWGADTVRGLLDVQFRRPVTRTLLPLVYLLGLAFALAVPVVLTVLAWQMSALLGVLAALVAIPLALSIAAAVRLLLEFLVNASRLATRVEHISDMADDLFHALSDVAEPMNQLSEDVRAVQFWRFRRGTRR
ncbi:DUF4282 domain-containing protein [Nocardia sp. NPDC024068]|uniref:DUF4282 domain-containing protein n=1 Tax=Nocardia sp. NPDC024068 TaxID=3157197 RepID=UPI0033FE3CE0